MDRGKVVANRFVIERLAGRGGMGSVYLATDRISGEPVALKILDGRSELLEERFFSEARALASVSHPTVVRYVAQGAGSGALWLAMEWLEGEDLSDRLARGRLDLASALTVGIRMAEGIAAAHAAGVIHRDLKPSNLFLVGGDPRALKVLDFGVARVPSRGRPITKTGQMVGTVGYMAPEQISGERDLDKRADIFALGCVLFESITGRPAFAGDTMIAIIAKVLREEPPRPSELEPRVPPALDDLILSMLAKPRGVRPDSAADVAAKLRTIAAGVAVADPDLVPPARTSVTGREQRLVSVILLAPPAPTEATKSVVERVGGTFGVDCSELGEGAFLLVVAGAGSAKDQAARAASCALALRTELSDVSLAVGTGLAQPTRGLPVGPAIDRAADLIDGCPRGAIAIDDVTAALLDDLFEVSTDQNRHYLVGKAKVARSVPPATRATPFVGRDKELAIIDAVLAESLSEPVARAVVVTGQAGLGKSRLRRELMTRALGREGVRMVVARADVVGSGSALSLARQVVERLALITEGELREVKAARLDRYVDTRFAGHDAFTAPERVHLREFLGELLSVPSQASPSAELSAARNEPRSLAEWLRRTFADTIRQEARIAPLVIVLEDLHWGDEASVEFVAEALRRASDLPLFVLALARTEVWEVLPRLREAFEPHEVRLGGLTPKAAQKLAESALGPTVTPEKIARIVARADGNPFFLKELARSAAEGRTDTSETVLAIVQSRIQRLDPEARRLLRAASVFGRVFRRQGVACLLGIAGDGPELDELLGYLDGQQLVERATVQDLSTDAAFAFCHDLVRDAAYATLPEVDRARAHLLAAEWLERSGEEDAALLADHYELAHEPGRAIDWLVRAAEQAQNAASNERVIVLAERGIQAGAEGELRGRLRGAEALAYAWRHDWKAAFTTSNEALACLKRGSTPWFRAAAVHFFAAVSTGNEGTIGELTASVIALAKDAEPTGPYGFAAFASINVLSLIGARVAAETLLAELDSRGATPSTDFGFVAWRALARVHWSNSVRGTPGVALRELEIARRFAPGLADSVVQIIADFYSATAIYECGDIIGGEQAARALLASESIDSVPYLRSWGTHILGRSLLFQGRLAEALELAESLMRSEDALLVQRGRTLAAQIHFTAGRFEQAGELARAVVTGIFAPQDLAVALAVEARLALRAGRVDVAASVIARAIDVTGRMGCSSTAGSMVRLVQVETVLAGNDPDAQQACLGYAQSRIESIRKSIGDPELAATWIAFPDNVRTVTLAREHSARA